MSELTPDEVLRYSRHLVMPEVGMAGQQRLRDARVLCIGAGGLGSPASLYLSAAGVGTLGIVDDDAVALSNLQRQVLYATGDEGRPKVEVAAERLAGTNPHVTVVPHPVRLAADNVMALVADYDLVLDGSDNFPTRYLVNDAVVLAGKPVVYGSVLRFDGQVSVFDASRGPCYRCLFPAPPPPGSVPSCAEGGVLGVLPGIVGSLQALEAIKLILGRGDALLGRLLLFDGLGLDFRTVRVERDPACPVCGEAPTIHAPEDGIDACAPAPAHAVGAGMEASARSVPGAVDGNAERRSPELLSPEALSDARTAGTAPRVLDVRNPHELDIVRLEDAVAIPLPELAGRIAELARDEAWVICCHKDGRAREAWSLLRDAGFEYVSVLEGGIDAWAERIDPSLNRYA